MRLLAVPQPLATILTSTRLHGRPVISRRFPASYRGRLALVAGALDRSALADALVASSLVDDGYGDPDELPYGRALALATLVDCHPGNGACCAPWGESGVGWFHLVLDDIRPFDDPPKMPVRPGLGEPSNREHNALLAAR